MATATATATAPLDAASQIEAVLATIATRDPSQPEFHQAVKEVLESIIPTLEANPAYGKILERLVEPERAVVFRVPWIDDAGNQRVNRGFRVQFSSAIGPYKGGLRFHPTVCLSVIKFLGFEQIFKNALTGLPMGGGKGGSDFDPKGKSDTEIMRFCQSFMTELHRHIGPQTDVPAGDIGVGGREVGYMFGQYKRLANEFTGILTGKGMAFGGSNIRPEATGYGATYFAECVLKSQNDSFKGKKVLVSGSGNVSLFAAEKLIELGATVLSLSDSNGTIYEPNGFTKEQISQVMELKWEKYGRLSEFGSDTAKYVEGKKPWDLDVPADVAYPCATQNEINEADAKTLVGKGVKLVVEGANMPSTAEAIKIFDKSGAILCAAKAANAGGVAVSGLEMAQNAMMSTWTREEVDAKLKNIMTNIYTQAADAAKKYGVNLAAGANIAGFERVATAMLAQGCV